MFNVLAIPVLKDNYIWAIYHPVTRHCAIVDPGEATPVLAVLQQHQLKLAAILITHHHADHSAGVGELLQHHAVPVYGATNSALITISERVDQQQTFTILDTLNLTVHAIPGHTLDHLAYVGDNKLFCGDTLFAAGCGRVFEGTYEQMYQSLQALKALPDTTEVYCGHEYTVANLQFAQMVEPHNLMINERLKTAVHLRAQNLPTLPSTIALEKQTNPFLRSDHATVITAVNIYAKTLLADPIEVFRHIRLWKNSL